MALEGSVCPYPSLLMLKQLRFTFICIILKVIFLLALQMLTEKVIEELAVFCHTVAKEKEMLQVRVTQPGSEHQVLREVLLLLPILLFAHEPDENLQYSSFDINTRVKETVALLLNSWIHQPGCYSGNQSI